MHEHVNIHILLSLLWDLCTQQCEKVCSANRGECVTTGCFYRPTHLCVAPLYCTKMFDSFFPCDVVRLGWSMFQEVGYFYGVSERGGVI